MKFFIEKFDTFILLKHGIFNYKLFLITKNQLEFEYNYEFCYINIQVLRNYIVVKIKRDRTNETKTEFHNVFHVICFQKMKN